MRAVLDRSVRTVSRALVARQSLRLLDFFCSARHRQRDQAVKRKTCLKLPWLGSLWLDVYIAGDPRVFVR
jgi:hypothetical protein